MTPRTGLDSFSRELARWIEELGHSEASLQPLPGDVSARRYARAVLADGRTLIAAHYPESMRNACRRFVVSTQLLQRAGVPVPRIIAADCEGGRMLLEDVGEETFFERGTREPESVPGWFRQAVNLADRIADLSPQAVQALNPPLDTELLRRELEGTWTAFADQRTPAPLRGPVQALFDDLCASLDDHLRPCHRDFMVRNLVPHGDSREIVVLDHQDLRLGPRFYDLASLLNDSLFPSAELTASLLGDRIASSADTELYHRTAAQRTLKAVGTYAAAAAAGNDRRLPLLEPTLRRALDHLEAIPEGRTLVKSLRTKWLAASREP